MKRLFLAIAFGSLAGCAWMYTPQKDVTGQQLRYTPGSGVIESVTRAPAPLSAASGGSAAAEPLYRLAIRMDDGRREYVDVADPGFARGMRVRLTEERLIEKP